MKPLLFLLWAQGRALVRRIVLSVLHANDPWEREQFVDPTSPTLQLLITQAEANEDRERGSMVCWSFARDRARERFWLRCEQRPRTKAARKEALRLVADNQDTDKCGQRRAMDEFTFRLNDGNVKNRTMARLDSMIGAASGKRLTYERLIQ